MGTTIPELQKQQKRYTGEQRLSPIHVGWCVSHASKGCRERFAASAADHRWQKGVILAASAALLASAGHVASAARASEMIPSTLPK